MNRCVPPDDKFPHPSCTSIMRIRAAHLQSVPKKTRASPPTPPPYHYAQCTETLAKQSKRAWACLIFMEEKKHTRGQLYIFLLPFKATVLLPTRNVLSLFLLIMLVHQCSVTKNINYIILGALCKCVAAKNTGSAFTMRNGWSQLEPGGASWSQVELGVIGWSSWS